MRINHRFDSRARLSTVSATDLERRYTFASIETNIGNLVQIADSTLPDIGYEAYDNNRLLARFDLTADIPEFAQLIVDFEGLFTPRGTLSLAGANVSLVSGKYAITAPGTIDLRLSEQSVNVHPDPAPGILPYTYNIYGIRVYQQVETIHADAKFTSTLNRELLFDQPLVFNRNITDYEDNP